MSKLSEKYLAGFLDSDGYIGIHWRGGKYSPQLQLEWSQKTSQDKVIEMIHNQFGGCKTYKIINNVSYTRVGFKAKDAMWILSRIRKHLVIKRSYADYCMGLVAEGKAPDWKKRAKQMKEVRKIKSLPLPNFPSRKWLAGYIDGDGSFYGSMQRNGLKQSCTAMLSIGCANHDTEGIEIIHKNFGGNIINTGENTKSLVIYLQPTKAKEMISYFGQHLITKKDQAYFILGIAEKIGHYRDGKKICSALKYLKACQHRLSEPEVDVGALCSEIKDIPYSGHQQALKRQSAGQLTYS
jgi:uncharacterized protein YlbG (UPF0298 family)